MPTAVGMTIGFAVLGQTMIKKFGRSVINIGAVVFASGVVYSAWIITHYALDAHPWQFIPGFLFAGIGLSLIMIPIFSAALQDVDPGHAGSASGILNAVQQVGAAVGIAIIGVIFFGQLTHGAYQSFDDAAPKLRQDLSTLQVPEDMQENIITQTRACYHDRATEKDANVVPESCKAAEASMPQTATTQQISSSITTSAKEANARNFGTAFRAGVIYTILLLAVVCTLSLTLPRKLRMTEQV